MYLMVDMQTVTLYTPLNFNLSSIFFRKGKYNAKHTNGHFAQIKPETIEWKSVSSNK